MGDYIQTETAEGQVISVNIMHTRLRTVDEKTVVIPNSLLYTATLRNFTENGQWLVTVPISVSYDNTPQEVRTAVLEAAASVEGICETPGPRVLLDSYRSNDISYIIEVYTTKADYRRVRFELNEAVYDAFKKHNVAFSYPHINVHMQ